MSAFHSTVFPPHFLLTPCMTRHTSDDKDYELITQSPITAGSTILYVPSDIVLNSDSILYEMGDYIAEAEASLGEIESL